MTTDYQAVPQTSVIKLIWLAMLGSPASLYVVLVIMDYLNLINPAPFKFAEYIFYSGFALIPIATLGLRISKAANDAFLQTLKRDPEQARYARQTFLQKLILGMAIADVPATIAIAYYFLSGDIDKAALLVMSSLIICYFFKPELPSPQL